ERFWDEIWNQGDMEAVDQIVASNFILYLPVGEIEGPEGLKQYVTTVRSAFPDIYFNVDEVISQGDRGVTRWSAQGTNDGPFLGRAATGKKITLKGITIFHIVVSKIVEERVADDTLGLMQQLGIVPAKL